MTLLKTFTNVLPVLAWGQGCHVGGASAPDRHPSNRHGAPVFNSIPKPGRDIYMHLSSYVRVISLPWSQTQSAQEQISVLCDMSEYRFHSVHCIGINITLYMRNQATRKILSGSTISRYNSGNIFTNGINKFYTYLKIFVTTARGLI